MTQGDRPELRALTGLRFLAAFYVLVFHALFTFSRASLQMRALRFAPLRALLSSGYVGVNLFFVLSGFVLAYAYVEDGKLTTTPARFWWARFARIYPMHLVGLLLALPLFALGSAANHVQAMTIAKEGGLQLALSALLVQAWVPAHVLDLNGPSWSLSVEAFFYAIFPLLVRLFGRLRVRSLGALAVVAWGLALLPPLVHGGPAGVLARTTDLDLVLLYDPLVRLPEFLLGVTSGLLFLRTKRTWSRAPIVATATFLLIFALLAASDHLPFPLLHNGLLDPLFALLVFTLASARDGRGLASDPLVRGGEASYSLYVLHKPVYFWLARAANVAFFPSSGFLVAYVGGSVALSLLARRCVEEPVRRALTGRQAPPTPPPRRQR
ncbi:MAG: acyltransferase family protein [Polyangiaceae bacterium]